MSQKTIASKAIKAFYVKWLDACSNHDQSWTSEITGPMTMESIGWLHTVDPEYITLIMNLAADGEFSGDLSIPAGCILEMKEIKL